MASPNKRMLRSLVNHLKNEDAYQLKIPKLTKGAKEKSKPRERIKPEYESERNLNPNNSDKVDEPQHWEEIYRNIQLMRMKKDAAVDLMGAEKCSDITSTPKEKRLHTLLGLMLSSQTKDAVTHAAVTKLKDHGATVGNILNTSQEVLEKLIYPASFYKRKAEYILRTCEILKEKYDSDIPSSVKELCQLPGVGQKMAYLCMDIAWNKMEGIGVDTHVHRISNRLGWAGKKGSKTPEETRKALEQWLPKDKWKEINLLLVGFGQQICLPVRPKCSLCLNKHLCPYSPKTPATTNKPHQK